MSEQPLLVSFSGGKTSGLMSWLIQTQWHDREKIFVFSNTGKEREETLIFVDRCDKEWGLTVIWLEAAVQPYGTATKHKVVTFETAARNGEPFEAMIAKYGIPNSAFKHCSRELKANVIRSYALSLGWDDYETAMGIRADEQGRINREEALKNDWIFPLTDTWPTRKQDVKRWWEQQPFNLELKDYEGNCDLCWKKSDQKLIRLINEGPERCDWWDRMETEYGSLTTAQRSAMVRNATFFRGSRSTKEMRRLAEQVGLGLFPAEHLSEIEQECFCAN